MNIKMDTRCLFNDDDDDAIDTDRDRAFDPWRRPASERAEELNAWVLRTVASREAWAFARKRKRRPADQHLFEETVTAIVWDAIHRDLTHRGGRVMVSLSNRLLGTRSRYRPPVFSKVLPQILKIMDGSFVDLTKGIKPQFGRSRQSTFSLSANFRPIVTHYGIGLGDLKRRVGGECIILKQAKENYWASKEQLEYVDTEITNRYREEMKHINARIATIDLEFDQNHPKASAVDVQDRLMRRIFNNGRFDHGGRLYGGFWQSLSKGDRLKGLLIDGLNVASLDFKQMAPRLLYGRTRSAPPGDCYAVPGYERFRKGWKKLLNALLFEGENLHRLPMGTRTLLPRGLCFDAACRLLLAHNAPIAPHITKNVGFELMFLESEVLIDVLLELEKVDIPALPVHDAVLVPDWVVTEAQAVMAEVFKRHTGYLGEVSVEKQPVSALGVQQ